MCLKLKKNIVYKLFWDSMSLIHEYGENKYNDGKDDGIELIIVNLLKSGDEAIVIAKKSNISLEKVLEIKQKNKL